MEFQETIQGIESTKEFQEWKKNHPDFYLVHAFKMLDEANKHIWQIGYYNKDKNQMETVIKDGNKITFVPAQEILKSSQEILPLNPEEVKISQNQAIDTALACVKENYPKDPVLKSFFIIQHLEGATIYNITYVTQTFKTINIKISSIDGKIIKHSCKKLADFS